MKADIEIVLRDDGVIWIASNDDLTAKGATLNELDDDLRRILLESGRYKAGSSVTVFMGYDYSVIPTWIRQYAYHYFNRLVTIDL